MRYHNEEEAKQINAEPWQLALLDLNPSYCSWGPHEDYMWTKGDGWNSAVIQPTWQAFGPWEVDDLNECVNFYFDVSRSSKKCEQCGGDGYHEKAQAISNTFYAHMNERGEHWNDKITQDEFEALQAEGRCKEFSTVEQVNAANAPAARGMGHDAINRWILIDARLKRLGIPKHCETCSGNGYIYTEERAHVSLVLWWLHPRKGCSRGIEIERIEQADLPAVFELLRESAERNAQRFSKIPASI